jgi:hypothetical protein
MLSFVVAIAFGLLAAAIVRLTGDISGRRLTSALAFGALLASSLIAFVVASRLLLAGPAWWSQAALTVSIIVAVAPVASRAWMLARRRVISEPATVRSAILVGALALALPHLAGTMDRVMADPYSASWNQRREFNAALRPGETVWIGAARHPITAPDDAYFWYGLGDLMPMMLELIGRDPEVRRYLPPITVDSLPVCRVARGRPGNLRFIEISAYAEFTPGACACAQMALSRPDLVPTSVPGVYEVVRPGSRPIGPGHPQDWDSLVRSRVALCATR